MEDDTAWGADDVRDPTEVVPVSAQLFDAGGSYPPGQCTDCGVVANCGVASKPAGEIGGERDDLIVEGCQLMLMFAEFGDEHLGVEVTLLRGELLDVSHESPWTRECLNSRATQLWGAGRVSGRLCRRVLKRDHRSCRSRHGLR